MLSVPLTWHDQTSASSTSRPSSRATFSRSRRRPARAPSPTCSPGIVEKGRQQTEAEARVEALKAIDEARSELIALVTHELRTPLAVVRAYTDLLAEEPPLRGPRVARHRAARDARRLAPRDARADRAAGPARRLDPGVRPGRARRAGRGHAGRRRARSSTRSSASLRPLLGRHRVEVAPSVRLHGLADPPRLRQILEHLVENAVKYAPPDTTITIDWSLVEGVVQLGVSDEGPGIPEEWRERIFEPYARRDTHTARGSGIGLYAAKRLGESMGARLWCEPARPHGARFVVALPAAVAV